MYMYMYCMFLAADQVRALVKEIESKYDALDKELRYK